MIKQNFVSDSVVRTTEKKRKLCSVRPCEYEGCENERTYRAAMCLACRRRIQREKIAGILPSRLSRLSSIDRTGLVTAPQAAQLLGVTTNTFFYYPSQGLIRRVDGGVKGQAALYRIADVERLRDTLRMRPEERAERMTEMRRGALGNAPSLSPSQQSPPKNLRENGLLAAIHDGKASPITGRTGFWVVYRPFTGEYRVMVRDGVPELGERRLLEYQRGIRVISPTRQTAVWEVFPCPLAGPGVRAVVDKLHLAEQQAMARGGAS